jgi:hypothetical protein
MSPIAGSSPIRWPVPGIGMASSRMWLIVPNRRSKPRQRSDRLSPMTSPETGRGAEPVRVVMIA